MYERRRGWCSKSTCLFSKSFLADYTQIRQIIVFFCICTVWNWMYRTVCCNMPSKVSCLLKLPIFKLPIIFKNIPSAVSMALQLKPWQLSTIILPADFLNFYLTEYCNCTGVSAPWCAKWNSKHTNSGGSPVIHRLEDNRQMMNDEDEWHSTQLNVALNKWIPRALLIISMSFPPAMYQHKSC